MNFGPFWNSLPCCRIPEKGVPQAKTKNCLDPKKQEPIEQTRSRPKSPIRPRPPRRGLRGSNESPIRLRPPRRGLRRSTDSPIRARPARHQPRGHLFNQTALTERRIQAPNHSDRRTMAQYGEVTGYMPVASTPCHLRWHRAGVIDHCVT